MLVLSKDPNEAERQMQAAIFLLTTLGYVDGDFDESEQAYIRGSIRSIVQAHVAATVPDDAQVAADLTEKFTLHFLQVFDDINQRILNLFTEPVAQGETPIEFVLTKLKTQSLALLQCFNREGQGALFSLVDELILADGTVHPAEAKFRSEMTLLLAQSRETARFILGGTIESRVRIDPMRPGPAGETHPFFTRFEVPYSRNQQDLAQQIACDRQLLDQATDVLERQRSGGRGWLAGHKTVGELAGVTPFLDEHVYLIPHKPGRAYELLVIGDLHGCYSVLKAALMQSRFFEKVNAFTRDPVNVPEPKLIFLGDFVDRGLFAINGVLRVVLQLFVAAPRHVYLLRGNHEFFVERAGKVIGGVMPADTIEMLRPHFPVEALRHLMRFFETLPNMMFFESILFVHGGLPRDHTLKRVWQDLKSLNDPQLRFEMMWSDPSQADVVPTALQDTTMRFAFGKLQFRSFMERIGCHTMIRGHEMLNAGFASNYDGGDGTLLTLFSAGGHDNDDLPQSSPYRVVTPMVLTVIHNDKGTTICPWAPDYKTYNHPERNAFFRISPEPSFVV